MKSKRAKEKLLVGSHYDSETDTTTTTAEVAIIAVKLAEADARERAARAFCSVTCPGRADTCVVYGTECPEVEQFKTRYDND